MFLKLATAIVAAAMVLRGVRTETHTVSFTNNCGFGTPYLWGPDGVLLSTGDDYTTNGPAPGLIAYLQCDDRCGNNGEGCTTVDATLTNEGNSVVEILNNSLNSVTTSIEFCNCCAPAGASCTYYDECPVDPFYPINDTNVSISCTIPNADLAIMFCD